MNSNREMLMRNVQLADFGVIETNLFLDTHPYSKEAMSAFEEYRRAAAEAREAYEKNYGPLTATADPLVNNWAWVQSPWPWQMEE